MSSLQKPRKITIVGSDGLNYTFLCKPKDDLRKDAKVMEFNGFVNMFLRKDPETSKRCLYIRTYAVVPLNEECGLIEWVHNTIPFRHNMQRLYMAINILLHSRFQKSSGSLTWMTWMTMFDIHQANYGTPKTTAVMTMVG
ncbi:serine/threonine-protein kinase M1 [Modicella reniformis]|uniref:Serine/threonine-protein kinase M1 n=1 Tax=Modicella reniformis TaxID=1440133 RepID=A0A9P6MLB0_9FUNG|nr:serine/threonine-protein kinase M1 [Modicella reniformis]